MFSAVNSLLPSVLQFNHDSNQLKPQENGHIGESTHPPTLASVPNENSMAPKSTDPQEGVDELGIRKKRLPTMNETFIIVRPPPAKSNHPLNLQLQLVPPSAPRVTSGSTVHSVTSRQSMESMNNPLERITPTGMMGTLGQPSLPATAGPNRSVTDISLYSSYSTTSLASNISSSSSVTSNANTRRIVPLYNLSAHNVMQNTVLDAGTDAKVAKFSKKGLEIIDLGFFELFEVWDSSLSLHVVLESSHPKKDSVIRPSTAHNKEKSPVPSLAGLSVSASNASSSSLPDGTTPRSVNFAEQPPKEEKDAYRKGARKVFGRLFKKKDDVNTSPSLLRVPNSSTAPATVFKRVSAEQSVVPPSPTPTNSESAPLTSLLPPVLDLQATLIKSDENSRRPASYVWVVRRWLKKNRGEGLRAMLSAAGDKMSSLNFPGLSMSQDDRPMEFEIRFDWERCNKRKRKRGRQTSPHRKRHSVHSEDGADVGHPTSLSEANLRSGSQTRCSPDRESESAVSREHAAPESEDSDPEDSETPWTCAMTLRRLHSLSRHPSEPLDISPTPSHIRPATSGDRTEVSSPPLRPFSMTSNLSSETREENLPIRVKVASLYPAPHHPKVVAQLKVPFPLPDVDVCQGIVYRRKGKRNEKESARREQSFMLSAEEIKDILCTTAFWLIVREGFGGVGKEKRKGDGWRIRA